MSPPGDPNTLVKAREKARWYGDYCFAIDPSGQPWVAIPSASVVLRPTQQVQFRLSHPFTGMTCLSNGALLFVTDHDLGMIGGMDRPTFEKGVAVLPFQPVLSLPVPGHNEDPLFYRPPAWQAYPGSGNCLYVVGTDGDNRQEVLLLQPQAGKEDPRQVLRSFRKVFVSARPILAVAGDGQTTYVPLGRAVVRIQAGQTETELWIHPTDEIRELAYSPDAGLFYATNSAVGVIPNTGGTQSQLHRVLQAYLQAAPTNRLKAQKAKDVFFILRVHGGQLRPEEEPIVVDKRLHGWLPRDFILDVLKRNDQAVLDARDLSDPLLQRVVISRLPDMARAKTAAATSKEDYQAALALCDQAKTRAQVWKIEPQCPPDLLQYRAALRPTRPDRSGQGQLPPLPRPGSQRPGRGRDP